ncbi:MULTISPECIES: ATP-binding protein [unclassified Sphingopyxis]|uniref:ATP-binding protein n=1 Tax=unclassified Sphingopyxis TaxID=2614943 RepID=UPI00285A2DC6|nr:MULTISPECIES: ATP-binding protein [unclassified Sphingopyxis]MDR6833597.1 Cdc6-like AAA superfamily ATPase [Sphingopyxis sp. BE122]MDR7225866.1 Cdc6-like AAA superfamily ATPase [Sphingopyxis sp. BE259]
MTKGFQLNFDDLLKETIVPTDDADWDILLAANQTLFKPKAPIDNGKLFSGRIKQIQDVLDVVWEEGGHAVIFGERGVGKTSLANIIDQRVISVISSVKSLKVSCSPGDSFFQLWSNILHDYQWDGKPVPAILKNEKNPFVVYKILESLDSSRYHLFIFDEFDRIKNSQTTTMMADLIKHFSNNPTTLTILIVGVGDTLIDLFSSHESISRCCTQIRMQRMSPRELEDILNERLPKLGMQIEQRVVDAVVKLSQALPGYVHLLGQLAAKSALMEKSLLIEERHLRAALDAALDKADYGTRQEYYTAVDSPAKDHLYKEVLLACALAETNELGLFYAGNVREPYSKIRGRKMDIAHYATHLSEFCSDGRGPALLKTGKPKRYQYRFANPMLQPLVVMMGVRDKLIPLEDASLSTILPLQQR